MPAVATTGKQCTFTYKTLDASAQVTSVSVDRSASTETTQTLADAVTVAADKEITYNVDFLFDPDTSSLFNLLHAAFVSGEEAQVVVNYNGATSTASDVVVTSLSDTAPADGLVTVSASLVTSTPDVFAPTGA